MFNIKRFFNVTKSPASTSLSLSLKSFDSQDVTNRLISQWCAIQAQGTPGSDLAITKGANWYRQALTDAHKINFKLKGEIPIIKIVGVIACLSPQNKWELNLRDAEALCTAWLNDSHEQTKVATFNGCKEKAITVLDSFSDDFEHIGLLVKGKSGLKTQAFYYNILGSNEAITLDLWACRHALNLPINLNVSVGGKPYLKLAECFKTASLVCGVDAFVLQATLWVYLRDVLAKGQV